MRVRRSRERGTSQMDWLDSKHSFSFGNYYDQKWMSFGPLRVINDDYIGGGGGFDPHPHQDMEIISYVTEGGLAHRDSMGHSSVVTAGRTQRMSAGRGVIHSEHNASKDAPVHLYQIWIQPDQRGIAPEYEELDVAAAPVLDTPAFYAACRRLLTDHGCMTVNLFGRASSFTRSVERMADAFGTGALWPFKATREGNTVVLAQRTPSRPARGVWVARAAHIEKQWGLPASQWVRVLKPLVP